MTKSLFVSLIALPLLAVACAAPSSSDEASLTDEERALLDDPEVGQTRRVPAASIRASESS